MLARGGPGAINFLAIIVYTRLLVPEQYGQYTLVLAGLGLIQLVGFQWLGLCLARFLPKYRNTPELFLSEIKFLFSILAFGFSVLGLIVVLLWPDPVWQRLIAIAVPLLVMQAWFELNLLYAAAALKPGLYGRINLTKSAVALSLGATLAWLGLGAYSPLMGLLLGVSLATLIFARGTWHRVKFSRPKLEKVKMLLAYGMPVAANFALVWVIASSDRFLIGWLLDLGSAGQYAVGYDLAQYSIGMLLMIVNLAAYPLAIHAFESGGQEAAQNQLRKNGSVIFSVALTASVGVAILAPLLGGLLLGVEYREVAIELLPWVALAAALSGIKAYYFDISFHLGGGTMMLVWISAGAALVNVLFNLMLIPSYGILGAAYATVLAYFVGMVASAWFGRRFFVLPDTTPLILPVVAVAIPSAIAVWAATQMGGWMGLVFGLLAGLLVAVLLAISINLAGIRHELRTWFQT